MSTPDRSELQLTLRGKDSSLCLCGVSSGIITRGLRDAAILASKRPSVLVQAITGLVCETCGERKELTAPDDDYCYRCRPREQRMAEMWHWWGFDRFGRPLNKIWDSDAQWRDSGAKLEIDSLLQEMGLPARWVELWWGFGATEYAPIRRGQAQALSLAEAVNEKWGFDSDGSPLSGDWDEGTRSQAAFALAELKSSLARVGLPLPDVWPDEWSPAHSYVLSPLEISESVWPSGLYPDQRWICSKCGEEKQPVSAGGLCSSCAFALG